MTQAMIVSLGGTPEPIVRTLCEHRPRFVCFLASHQSVYVLGQIKELLKAEGFAPQDSRTVLAENVDDLLHCYEKALECAHLLEKWNVNTNDVVVDYTGGTKNMTAALALATVGKGYQFSYVGGARRNKNGLGVVEDGSEIIHKGVSPWQIFAVEEWRQLVIYTRHYNYEAAHGLIQEIQKRQPKTDLIRWQGMAKTLSGLLQWDQFNHEKARPLFVEGIQELDRWSQLKGDKGIADFVRQSQACLIFLNEMAFETRGFKQPGSSLVQDLVANARRRADQGRYDDAVARLYRALEMQAQLAFFQKTGLSTSEVPFSAVPEDLRDEYCRFYKDSEKNVLKIPLYGVFRLLEKLDDPVGRQFFASEKEFLRILNARNNSILAHGMQPVKPSTYESLDGLIRSAFGIDKTVEFPHLTSPF